MRFLRLGLVVCAATAFAACSGGGGTSPAPGGGSTATPTPTPVATSSATPSAMSPAIEHQDAQAGLSAVRPILIEDQLEQGLSAASFARKPAFARARRMTAGACTNGTEYSYTTSGTTTNFILDFYYDGACTMLWQNIAGKEVPSTIPGGAAETVTATDTVDGTSGTEIEFDAIAGTVSETATGTAFALTASTGPNASTVKGQLGADCTISGSATGTSETCSFGGLATLPSFVGYTGFGTVIDETSKVVAQAGGYTDTGSGTGTFYEGTAPPVMALANNGTMVTIAGASVAKTLAETETIVATESATPTATIAVTDAADNTIVVLNLSGYTITGKVEDATTLAVEATFTIDVNGNGTISYSNGTTGTISAFGVDS